LNVSWAKDETAKTKAISAMLGLICDIIASPFILSLQRKLNFYKKNKCMVADSTSTNIKYLNPYNFRHHQSGIYNDLQKCDNDLQSKQMCAFGNLD
jgi:hypothetical protein